jgi:hypothetical protein
MSTTAPVNSFCAVRNAGGTNIPNQCKGSLATRLALGDGDALSGGVLPFESELGVFGLGSASSNDGMRPFFSDGPVMFLLMISV